MDGLTLIALNKLFLSTLFTVEQVYHLDVICHIVLIFNDNILVPDARYHHINNCDKCDKCDGISTFHGTVPSRGAPAFSDR